MTERRRIRLAAVPYEEDDCGTQNFRRLEYKDDGSFEPTSIKKKARKRMMKANVELKATESTSRSRKQPRARAFRAKKTGANNNGNIMEDLETTTWSLLKYGRKLVEKSIEEGKIHALKAAMSLRKESDRSHEPKRGRGSRRSKKSAIRKRHPSLSSDESRSIESASSDGGDSDDSYGTFSYSDGEPSMSLSFSSSKSKKRRKPLKSKSNLKADPSYDSLGENSIIANDSLATDDSTPSMEASLTDQGSYDDDHTVVSGAWSKIDKIVEKSSADTGSLMKEGKRSGASKMEFLLEPDSSDSWIDSIQTDSVGSFSTALNNELGYHRQLPSTASLEPIQQRIDEIRGTARKSHQRMPTTELSDAEFLKVIRETVDQELGSKRTDPNTSFLVMIDKSKERAATPNAVSALSATDILKSIEDPAEVLPAQPSTLSNADFIKAMQQGNEVEFDQGEMTPTASNLSKADFLKATQQENGLEQAQPSFQAPNLSNDDFLKAMQQENGVGQDEPAPTEPILSNDDFLKAMQRENGVGQDAEPILSNADFLKAMQRENGVGQDESPHAEPILSNADFLKAMQQENGLEEAQPAQTESILSNADFLKAMQQENGVEVVTQSQLEQVVLTDDLSNADFLTAMKLSLSATGGKFAEEPEQCDFSTEVSSLLDLHQEKNAEQEVSNSDFLRALRQHGAEDDDTISESKESVQIAMNANFLSALKQLGGMDHTSSMYTHGKLDPIQEVDSQQSSPGTSPPTSMSFLEQVVVLVMDADEESAADQAVVIMDADEDSLSGNVAPQEVVVMDADEESVTPEVMVMDVDDESVSSDVAPEHSIEALITKKPDETGVRSMELPDLKCLSSEESDTHCDPVLQARQSLQDDIGDADTGFPTAGDILAEDDTQFYSVLTEKKEAESEAENDDRDIRPSDSLDEILGEAKPTRMESRQDEESSPSSPNHEEAARSFQDSRQEDDIAERNALIRAIQVDEFLSPEEKTMLIAEIENGVSIDDSASCAMSTTSDVLSVDRMAKEQSRMEINKAIGKKVMQGWTLLNSSCPQCMLPLMTDTRAEEAVCIFCDFSRSMKGDHGAKLHQLAPPPPPPMANKKGKKKKAKAQSTSKKNATTSIQRPNSLVVGSE